MPLLIPALLALRSSKLPPILIHSATCRPSASITTNDSASNSCSHSYKLATIPELELELEHEQTQTETCLKLSPNFNRIYASKIDIVMDRPEVAPPITQFDSLSSELEETSSNPDSGNASLADFPLAAHANASLELQTSYNSRFEVREHYVSEVSISTDDDSDTMCDGAKQEAEEFPRLPTEEELLESLREEAALNETENRSKIASELNAEQKLDETPALSQAVYDLTNESLIKELNDSSFDENDLVSIALDELQEAALNEAENRSKIASELNAEQKLDETPALSQAVYDLTSESLIKEVNDSSCDENELDENDLVSIALDEALLEEIKIDERAFNELAECELVQRKKSIVYETPQINLSISEVRLNYDTKAEQEESETTVVKKEREEEGEGDDMPIKDTITRNERHSSSRGSGSDSDVDGEANEIETRRRQGLPALTDERPTTSSKALSVFGEVRDVRPAAAAGAGAGAGLGGVTRGGLTTLEHVFVACTVGLITPNDLLTLCLIVIGVIIIVAIALT
ncbi:uncharacterized protein LOC135429144 [Drosophila montana]|uniref:uncharacterized protein LOC135429144 n=1 Tax=Drosophila montana TaxID=40370 RepID=UPI00313EBB41